MLKLKSKEYLARKLTFPLNFIGFAILRSFVKRKKKCLGEIDVAFINFPII